MAEKSLRCSNLMIPRSLNEESPAANCWAFALDRAEVPSPKVYSYSILLFGRRFHSSPPAAITPTSHFTRRVVRHGERWVTVFCLIADAQAAMRQMPGNQLYTLGI